MSSGMATTPILILVALVVLATAMKECCGRCVCRLVLPVVACRTLVGLVRRARSCLSAKSGKPRQLRRGLWFLRKGGAASSKRNASERRKRSETSRAPGSISRKQPPRHPRAALVATFVTADRTLGGAIGTCNRGAVASAHPSPGGHQARGDRWLAKLLVVRQAVGNNNQASRARLDQHAVEL